jgi:hypothetical protein
MTEQDPVGQRDAQAQLQQIADQVRARHGGAEVGIVRGELEQRIAAAGFPEQPEKWVHDLAAEISAQRDMVVDRRLAQREPSDLPPSSNGD